MSKGFILTGLIVCGTIFLLHLALWLFQIIHDGEITTEITMLTLVSGFATAMYYLYYRAKTGNENNRIRRK